MLAFDTSSPTLSVALFDGFKIVRESEAPLFAQHSVALAPAVDRLLKESRWKAEALDFICVGLGPGSFTGLRVGVTTAKVLAFASKAKLIAIPSLEILAAGAPAHIQRIAVARDAKKGNVYAALYKKNKKRFLKALYGPALTQRPRFEAKIKNALQISESDYPKASDLARLALGYIQEKRFCDPFSCGPLYIHPKDCNVTKPRVA